ncbi:hypothetical protein B842_07935 [Corynebacterium humireducens NBRC 106098 = DSM 45392]|uniref:AMIN-like domain-containing protein n=1 Tax=Corynebacterium humireducens NBRC 106098 = DSM 45392 TaxID=1223515 RepID=A0A0B5D3T2_9CORY|nr:hypothetical protein [Corynebacterium humireducens]AJE33436.1 hypothetical protein B842_07935 [Corynebacterium humireducens NBRC 106098 = DSM 45392]
MTAYRRPLTTAAVTAAALVLTACNGTGTTEGGTGTTSATPVTVTSTATTNSPAPTTPTTTTGTTTTVSATTAPVDRPLGTPTTASETRTPVMWDEPAPLVTGVRIGRHDTYTRVVYDLVGNGEPGWYSGYIDQPYQDGSGFPVDVQGNAYLMINITGTTYPFEHDAEELAIGPHPGTGVVREVVNTGVFEGNTLTYIGLDEQLPYSVTVLHSPLRVVVDIQHP